MKNAFVDARAGRTWLSVRSAASVSVKRLILVAVIRSLAAV
jgi:hypothetical protein